MKEDIIKPKMVLLNAITCTQCAHAYLIWCIMKIGLEF